MKLTKQRLKEIIKEELSHVLNEAGLTADAGGVDFRQVWQKAKQTKGDNLVDYYDILVGNPPAPEADPNLKHMFPSEAAQLLLQVASAVLDQNMLGLSARAGKWKKDDWYQFLFGQTGVAAKLGAFI